MDDNDCGLIEYRAKAAFALGDSLVGPFPRGRIPHDLTETAQHPGIIVERDQRSLGPEAAAVFLQMPAEIIGASFVTRPIYLLFRRVFRTVFRREDNGGRQPDSFGLRVAENIFDTRVPRRNQAPCICRKDSMIPGILNQQSELFGCIRFLPRHSRG